MSRRGDPGLGAGSAGARAPGPPGTGGGGWLPPTAPPAGFRPAAPPPFAPPGAGAGSPFATPSQPSSANPYAAPSAVPPSEYGPIRDIYDPNFAAAYYGGGVAQDATAQDVPAGRLTGLEPRAFRRRRAVLSGVATALAVVLVVGLIAFAVWQTQQGDDGREAALIPAGTPPAGPAAEGAQLPPAGSTEASDAAAGAGDVAAGAPGETPSATEPPAADQPVETAPAPDPGAAPPDQSALEGEPAAGDAGAAAAADTAAGDEPVTDPTANPGGRSLVNLVPAEDEVPAGFVLTDESKFDEVSVAATFGNPEEAQAQLQAWGWRGHLQRVFEWPVDQPAPAGATTFLIVSVHRFDSDMTADAALTYFSDAVIGAQALQPLAIEPMGDEALGLIGSTEGMTVVNIYVRTGPYLVRIVGGSPDGDPTGDVVNLAKTVLVNEPDAASAGA